MIAFLVSWHWSVGGRAPILHGWTLNYNYIEKEGFQIQEDFVGRNMHWSKINHRSRLLLLLLFQIIDYNIDIVQ